MTLGQPKSPFQNPLPLPQESWHRARERDLLAAIRATRPRRPPCPRCRSPRAHRWGTFRHRQRWKCTSCGRTFSDLTGTFLAHTRKLALWIAFADHLRYTPTVRAAAAHLGINKDTALRWRHRLIEAADQALGPEVLPPPPEAPFVLVAAQPFPYDPRYRLDRLAWDEVPVSWIFLASTGSEECVPALVEPLEWRGGLRVGMGAWFHALEKVPRDLGALTAHHPDCIAVHAFCSSTRRPLLRRVRWGTHAFELRARLRFLQGWARRFNRWCRRFHGIARSNLDRYLRWFRLLEMERDTLRTGPAAAGRRVKPLSRSRIGTLLACFRAYPPPFRSP